mgnify:CR=1 FL=1
MKITEVRVKLVTREDRLKAFCSMTLDDEFVVRDIKVIEGRGGHFVAMPSRKMTNHCQKCGATNHLRAKFCNDCGRTVPKSQIREGVGGKPKLHADIAHPINTQCRQRIQKRVIEAFQEELKRSKQPDYEPTALDEPDD